MDSDLLWHTFTGSALIAAALTIARLLLDSVMHARERRRSRDLDAEARLERFMQDRLAESDRRLERSEDELRAERERSASLEEALRRLSARRGSRR